MMITSAKFIKGIRGTDDVLYNGIPQIAFVGRSNVGKSSLINDLVRSTTLVKVGKKPGKTTEINFFLVNNEFYFVDLPGYGFARASLEEREKTRKMLLWYFTASGVKPRTIGLVVDSNIGLTPLDHDMIKVLQREKHHVVIIANKIDKLSGNERPASMAKLVDEFPDADIVHFSASKKENVTLVRKMLFDILGIR